MNGKFWLALLVAAYCVLGTAYAQGAGMPTQNVNVVNTPSVNLKASTEKIFDASVTSNYLSETIDVSPYKQIRIVGRCFQPADTMTVMPFVVYGGNPDFDVAALTALEVPCNLGASATYESPGQTIRIHVPAGSGRVVIYGRVN